MQEVKMKEIVGEEAKESDIKVSTWGLKAVDQRNLDRDRHYRKTFDKIFVARETLKSLLGEMKRLTPEEQSLRKTCVSTIHKYLEEQKEKEA